MLVSNFTYSPLYNYATVQCLMTCTTCLLWHFWRKTGLLKLQLILDLKDFRLGPVTNLADKFFSRVSIWRVEPRHHEKDLLLNSCFLLQICHPNVTERIAAFDCVFLNLHVWTIILCVQDTIPIICYVFWVVMVMQLENNDSYAVMHTWDIAQLFHKPGKWLL